MRTASTLVVPGEQRPSVLVRPVVGGVALGAGISAVVSAWLAANNEFDAGDPTAWWILVGPTAILAALGALQSLWWNYKLGDIRYEADVASLRVLRRDAVIHEWRWRDIHQLRLEGTVGWYSLIVLRAGTDDFPRLVVRADDGRTSAPGVLLWGRGGAQEYQRRLVEMHCAGSH